MILAGDIGGTKSLIGLFEPRERRPVAVDVRSFPTTAYPGLPAIVEKFLATRSVRPPVTAAAFGVAGPVLGGRAQMTNIEWAVDARELSAALYLPEVFLLNDLEATAYAVPVLAGDELRTLQAGVPRQDGNMGVVAAGTGLGGALLHHFQGQHLPVASELGHSDFAPHTDRELEFFRFARERFGRVEIEHVVSGPGLATLAEFTHDRGQCAAFDGATPAELPAEISASALRGGCADCVEALDLFVDAYGAVAGNLALTAVTTAGMFIAGGIAPRILPAIEKGRLIGRFNDKPPMHELLQRIPVHVILNDAAGLLGAAVYANQRLATS